ncbi:MAG: sialidase family protein [Planctomycetota bacterium]|nr:sialidase family protein [Planctomycetota bacterium]
MTWNTHALIQLEGLKVELSEPVLVKRSRWYCWFPSLIRQPEGTLWAVMSAYGDIHVTDSFNYLSRSRDGGLSWDEPRLIGDAGLSHLILSDGSALILPYYLRSRGDDLVGAPCNVISTEGGLSFRASGVTVTHWPRPIGIMSAGVGTASFVFNGQTVRGRDGEYLTTLYGTFAGDKRYSLLMAESTDGFAWRIRSVIAGHDCELEGVEGPCESATCRLADGRLMCAFRLASFVRYGQAFSDDDGRTWSKPTNILPLSVEPSLARLGNGMVALSGGRSGVFVWFNPDGRGQDWQAVDIVAAHNAARPAADQIDPNSRGCWLPVGEIMEKSVTGFSSCYTELMALDEKTLLLIYDRVGLGWHQIPDDSDETKSVWAMRLTLK